MVRRQFAAMESGVNWFRFKSSPIQAVFVQTFGDLANFNSHVHVLAADGVFAPDGTFVPLPVVPEWLPAEGFRRADPRGASGWSCCAGTSRIATSTSFATWGGTPIAAVRRGQMTTPGVRR